jgi:four helix bundle protein
MPLKEDELEHISSHRDLVVWQKAMELAVQTYRLAGKFPATETYRLGSQLTRAVASVPANIAEGHARGTKRDYANFLAIAKGSLMETETFLMLAVRLGFLGKEETASTFNLIIEVSKMLTVLRSRIVEKPNR